MDTPPDRVPADILDSYPLVAYFNPAFQWPELRAHLGARSHNAPPEPPSRRYEQARVMGGGSSINAQLANRGAPADYDGWRAMGADGWGWEDVLPYFRKLERDMDFDGPLHGKDGPLPIRRIRPDVWPGFATAAAEAFARDGHVWLEDQNGPFEDGYFPIAISNLYDRRVSTAIAYLDNATRARPNLRVLAGRQIRRIVFEGVQAVGVEVSAPDGGGAERIDASEIVLCAGAIHSPALLMRSGIGPAGHLAERGIDVVADLPGVGQDLGEHPATGVSAWLAPEARMPDTQRRHIHVALRYSSGVEDCPQGDMYCAVIGKSAWHPVGWRPRLVPALGQPVLFAGAGAAGVAGLAGRTACRVQHAFGPARPRTPQAGRAQDRRILRKRRAARHRPRPVPVELFREGGGASAWSTGPTS